VLTGSKNIRFDNFVLLVEGFGFELKRVSGSHHIFKHPEVKELLSLQPAQHGRAKPIKFISC
jgi:predicted RNA binding protein YcfA (HicA-like mRNA interferase family)